MAWLAPGQDSVGCYVAHGALGVRWWTKPENVVAAPSGTAEHALHTLGGRWHDGEALGPAEECFVKVWRGWHAGDAAPAAR